MIIPNRPGTDFSEFGPQEFEPVESITSGQLEATALEESASFLALTLAEVLTDRLGVTLDAVNKMVGMVTRDCMEGGYLTFPPSANRRPGFTTVGLLVLLTLLSAFGLIVENDQEKSA